MLFMQRAIFQSCREWSNLALKKIEEPRIGRKREKKGHLLNGWCWHHFESLQNRIFENLLSSSRENFLRISLPAKFFDWRGVAWRRTMRSWRTVTQDSSHRTSATRRGVDFCASRHGVTTHDANAMVPRVWENTRRARTRRCAFVRDCHQPRWKRVVTTDSPHRAAGYIHVPGSKGCDASFVGARRGK